MSLNSMELNHVHDIIARRVILEVVQAVLNYASDLGLRQPALPAAGKRFEPPRLEYLDTP